MGLHAAAVGGLRFVDRPEFRGDEGLKAYVLVMQIAEATEGLFPRLAGGLGASVKVMLDRLGEEFVERPALLRSGSFGLAKERARNFDGGLH